MLQSIKCSAALIGLVFSALALVGVAAAEDITAQYVHEDLSEPEVAAEYWAGMKPAAISLMAQPMINPRPKETTTNALEVKCAHDGKWIAFHLSWKDTEKNEAGKLGEFSDAAAMQFPIKPNDGPPPIFMGAKGAPVHIFHWRAQYQRDMEKGKPKMKDLYPNLSIDVYPMDFPDWGNYQKSSREQREQFSPGLVAGNPQTYQKTGVDEIYAEGFSTSSVQEGHKSLAKGQYKDGMWNLVIARPLKAEGGSVLVPGKNSFVAFAVWQGGKGEVGSRKSVTMVWTPLVVKAEGDSLEN